MKKSIFLFAALSLAVSSYAQTVVATLTHNDATKAYYGSNAFSDALEDAEHGDVINLSGGFFKSVDISKAVTIRGTGFDDPNPTVLTDNFEISIPSDVTERFIMEGCTTTKYCSLSGDLSNAYFAKNKFYGFTIYDQQVNNITVLNCILERYESSYGAENINMVNSYVNVSNIYYGSTSFFNCVVKGCMGYASYVNCILKPSSYYGSCSAVYCVGVGIYTSCIYSFDSHENCATADMSIFVESNEMNDLTDAAKAQYIGNDGTPIGMYGGVVPFNSTSPYPRITRMDVANKTTSDGKLSVEIEVSAQ